MTGGLFDTLLRFCSARIVDLTLTAGAEDLLEQHAITSAAPKASVEKERAAR